jgi:hypothetical protein
MISSFGFGESSKCRSDLLLKLNRPTNEHGERVSPSDLRFHRLSHAMLGPCCLCPLLKNSGEDFVESAIYMVGHGLYAGEYVASCANGECGYFGKCLTRERV